MSRAKKDYKNFSIRMDAEVYDNLVAYAEEKGQTLTKAVELILAEKFAFVLNSKQQKNA